MTTLVIGYGSIGKRHCEVLSKLGEKVIVKSSQAVKEYECFESLKDALAFSYVDRVVISNKTVDHIPTLNSLTKLGFKGKVLVEKPLGMNLNGLFNSYDFDVFVAYNLRFHPITIRLKELLKESLPLFAIAYVGQYLPDWRENRDYRNTYSAKKSEGGGVLRDLSHEIDLLQYLLGPLCVKTSVNSKISNLEIESDDFVHMTGVSENKTHWSVCMNYIDKNTSRFLKIVSDSKSIDCDFVNGIIKTNGEESSLNTNRNSSYENMHKHFLSNNDSVLCNFDEGKSVMDIIELVEEKV